MVHIGNRQLPKLTDFRCFWLKGSNPTLSANRRNPRLFCPGSLEFIPPEVYHLKSFIGRSDLNGVGGVPAMAVRLIT